MAGEEETRSQGRRGSWIRSARWQRVQSSRLGRKTDTEILVRLPLKDLVRCKAVCKGWRDLISSPDFASQHLLRSQSDPSHRLILFQDLDAGILRGPARHPGSLTRVVCFSSFSSHLVGSVNGLICFAGNYCDGVTSPDDIFILNPVTSLSFKLPPPASPTVEDCDAASFAFCWDSEARCYKVFKVVCKYMPFVDDYDPHHPDALRRRCTCIKTAKPVVSNRVEVWDSRYPHQWSKIIVEFPPFYHPPRWITAGCDIVVGSLAYWIVADAGGLDLFLLSIDIHTHAVKLISLPRLSLPSEFLIEELAGYLANTFLFGAIWEERFALVERPDSQTMLLNVWAMNDDSETSFWVKKKTFVVDFGFTRFTGCVDGKLLLEQNNNLKALFDMDTQKCEVLGKTEFRETQRGDLGCFADTSISWKYLNSKKALEKAKTHSEDKHKVSKREVVVEDNFANILVYSPREFVPTLVSIKGLFKPIGSFAKCPQFNVFWPCGANVPSGVKPDTRVSVSPPVAPAAKGSVPSAAAQAEKVKVKPVGGPAANEARKATYVWVAKMTPVNSSRGAPKPLPSVTKVATKSMTSVPVSDARGVYVHNLPGGITKKKICEVLRVFGPIGRTHDSVRLKHQMDGCRSACVEFINPVSARLAVEASKVDFGERVAFVEFKKPSYNRGSYNGSSRTTQGTDPRVRRQDRRV